MTLRQQRGLDLTRREEGANSVNRHKKCVENMGTSYGHEDDEA